MSFLAKIQRTRQRIYRQRSYQQGVLGNGSGTVYASSGRYYVRFLAGTDENGNTTYTKALPMRYAGEGTIPAKEGVEVLVKRDVDGVPSIFRVAPDYYDRAGIDSRAMNMGETFSRWIDVRNIIRWLTRPVGSDTTNTSTVVTIRENPFYVDNYMDWHAYAGTVLAATKPDLAAYIPAADYHCLAIIFFDTLQGTYAVYASTTQDIATDLDSTDYDECFAQLPHQEYHPLMSIELADNQSSVDINDVKEDLRQIMNMPQLYGFPNPIESDKGVFIRSTHQVICYNLTVEGTLTIEGNVTVL
jgi:hypothetical protein